MTSESGALKGSYTFHTRFEEEKGTNPEELIAAAHAGCFSMALSNILSKAGHEPTSIETTDKVHLEKGDSGFGITRIEIHTTGEVDGVSEDEFRKYAEEAKENCPVSKALKSVSFDLKARLK